MRRLQLDVPQVFTPGVLILVMICLAWGAISDVDEWMYAMGPALLVDAVLTHIGRKLREG